MEKTITIDGKEVTFKSTGAVPKRYKMQFGRDFFADLLSMNISNKKRLSVEDMRTIDFDVFYDIAWTLAKTADSTIKEPLAWLDGFESFPIIEILPQIQDLLIASIQSKKN